MSRFVPLAEAQSLPLWRRPITLLFLTAVAMPIAFYGWNALLNNFVIEVAQFDGADIGLLHSVREIPGFLAIGVIAIIIFMREQVLGLVSLCLLGVATAFTAWFPSLGGLLTLTMLSSIGFHYYETVNQSLQLQWIPKEKAPQVLGWLLGAASASALVVFVLIVLLWEPLNLSYNIVFMLAGGTTAAIALFCLFAYPQFEAPHPQLKTFVLRRRYWLYYALQFMSGARRQIFMVFAGFMMVERFGFEVHELTSLYLINLVVNMAAAPFLGRAVGRYGERRVLIFEYVGLTAVFTLYGGIYWFSWGVVLAAVLYVIDHILFGLALALKTYFQKIADPRDIAPTAAVAFTINHIAAVFLPALLGLLWVVSPGAVFALASGMALTSLCLALMIPRHPEPGNETIFAARGRAPLAAERPAGMSQPPQAERADRPGRFVTGSVMGHVVRMTMTGAFGITFVFVVDAANLIWISWLGDPRLVAAVGFAFAIQFLAVSSGVGLMIASTALISRRIGAGQRAQARRDATSATVIAFVWQTVVAMLVIGFRHQILALSGAEGETARLAARYLAMSMPSLTIMAISLVANGALRAQGDGARSMYVTLVSGAVAMVVDPLLIYGLGLGLDGAAMGINLFRIIMVGMALRYAIGTHDLLARPALADVRATLAPYLAVALPAILTQLATPSGNYLMTTVIARYGDEAVAGWAVVGRLTVVAFGGIFSLAGAIGGIFGQNFGAGQHDRLRTIYRDALVFGLGYTAITWAVLVMVSPAVIAGLNLGDVGAKVVRAFAHVGAGGFLFATALFVSNAAFNALGRPLWGTLTTWARDGVFSLPLALWLAAIYGAAGVIYAQAAASALVGVVAAVLGWRFVQGLAAGQLVPEAPIVTRSLANADRVRRR